MDSVKYPTQVWTRETDAVAAGETRDVWLAM